ncbi:MAG: hypothetical protein ISS46_04135, partial [Candidatus Omnitrophica bacterium]|nr:hypothetical protein [Candidatus Omnitrophota bacterium]
SGLAEADCRKIVSIVRAFRREGTYKHPPTIRESIKIAKVLKENKEKPLCGNEFFKKLCFHVLTHEPVTKMTKPSKSFRRIEDLIKRYC